MLALLCALAGRSLTAQEPPNAPVTASGWDQPAMTLAMQVAAILGPGQASFSLRNNSSLSSADLPAIRRLFEQDLKMHGVTVGGQDSANAIHLTLSEDTRERLWVAEIAEGNETRVTMVKLPLGDTPLSSSATGIVLHRQSIYQSNTAVIAALALTNDLVLAEPGRIVALHRTAQGWRQTGAAPIGELRVSSRDARAVLLSSPDGHGFDAWLPGVVCNGSLSPSDETAWEIHCRQADDPWPITGGPVKPALATNPAGNGQDVASADARFKAFYNASRDYFTGIVTPSPGPDLPAFYAGVNVPLAGSQTGLLIEGLDGRIQLVSNNMLASVQGTRDWGSDFTVVHTGCGSGIQVIASSSGNTNNDSLRAYELVGLQMTPSGSTLAVEGSVTALSTAQDGTAALVIVRTQQNRYEVERVTASCN